MEENSLVIYELMGVVLLDEVKVITVAIRIRNEG